MDPFEAIELENVEELRVALDQGFDVTAERNGMTLLHYALNAEIDSHTQTGEPLHVDATALLLARGADPKWRPNGGAGMSAEHMALVDQHWLALELFRAFDRERSSAQGDTA